jgi:hypothetical protein
LERSPTGIADVTATASAVRRINVGGAQIVGEIDNERSSSWTYATATGRSDSAVGHPLAVVVGHPAGIFGPATTG